MADLIGDNHTSTYSYHNSIQIRYALVKSIFWTIFFLIVTVIYISDTKIENLIQIIIPCTLLMTLVLASLKTVNYFKALRVKTKRYYLIHLDKKRIIQQRFSTKYYVTLNRISHEVTEDQFKSLQVKYLVRVEECCISKHLFTIKPLE